MDLCVISMKRVHYYEIIFTFISGNSEKTLKLLHFGNKCIYSLREGEINFIINVHILKQNSYVFSVIWTRSMAGKELAIINGYTFYCHTINKSTEAWLCSTGYKKCKARVKMTRERKIIDAHTNHSHPPHKYIIRNGVCIKV